MKTCVVLMFLIAACVPSSSALRCYSCTFPDDPKCTDIDPKDMEIETCDNHEHPVDKMFKVKSVCIKKVDDVEGVKQVTRSCSTTMGNLNDCAFASSEHCSLCDSYRCNGSSNLLIKFWTMLMPIAIALFMKSF